MFLLMNKVVLSADLHELSFVEKQNCLCLKAFQIQHHHMLVGLTRFRHCWGEVSEIWWSVISMFSDPVYVNGDMFVSCIAKHKYCNEVTEPMKSLAYIYIYIYPL